MAIGYARIEFVKRSQGKSACAKAAYNSRSEVSFDGNCVLNPKKYDWSSREKPIHHEVILPSGVNQKFKDIEYLWNTAEAAETRSNSQVAVELVVALPDDKIVTKEDKIQLIQTFVEKHFVSKGLAAQIDIHAPERKIEITRENHDLALKPGMTGELIQEENDLIVIELDDGHRVSFDPKDFTGFIEKEHNWHAHVLIPTRRFGALGNDFGAKARDLMPKVAKGTVISGNDWGQFWSEHQNDFFKSKGLSLRVDHNGLVPQTHLGPVRMRARALSLLEENNRRIEENGIECRNPEKILIKLTEKQSVFTREDVERFFEKHVDGASISFLREAFWQQQGLIELLDKKTGAKSGKFSSKDVIEEERKILRLAAQLKERFLSNFDSNRAINHSSELNLEQRAAFNQITKEGSLSCIQGYAGTGKSTLLVALSKAYIEQGYNIRAFGPDNATAEVLKTKGFVDSENVYRFLFAAHAQNRDISKNKEIWILDEAGKLGNRPLLEFFKEAEKAKAKVILSGDFEQLPSVERGGIFRNLTEHFSDIKLEYIQRQKDQKQLEIAKDLAVGKSSVALEKLNALKKVHWADSKQESLEHLITRWAFDTHSNPNSSKIILAHTNNEVRVLNELVRDVRKQRGELSGEEYCCETAQGKIFVSVGDLIEFRKNDREKCLTNGLVGTLIKASENNFVVSVKEENKRTRIVQFNPQEYHAYQLAYAKTYFRAQGSTVDQAYVLHNSMMHKEAFYVGLTRHVQDVCCFVSKDNGYCLADLKRQASKSDLKETTLKYLIQADLESEDSQKAKTALIQDWKNSEEFFTKLKGHGFAIWDKIQSKTAAIYQRYDDKLSSKTFYTPVHEKDTLVKKPVIKIGELANSGNQLAESRPNLGIENLNGSQEKKLNVLIRSLEKKSAQDERFSLLEQYIAKRHLISNLYKDGKFNQQIKIEIEKRNEAACNVLQSFKKEELSDLVGLKLVEKMAKQALSHNQVIAQESNHGKDVLESLKQHIEPLLSKIFPEGPTKTTNTGFRFGSKGSLYVAVKGEKNGLFYDFERGEGGNLIQLIQRELGYGKKEAYEWAKNFVEHPSEGIYPKTFNLKNTLPKKDQNWISVRPGEDNIAPEFHKLSSGVLSRYFTEQGRHAYRDEDGRLLYYVLRLVDKNDPSKKITPPLSYGYWENRPKKLCWELKKPIQDKTSLYNLQLLKQYPNATILIVEGEKTADKAMQYFPGHNLITISWSGGCNAVDKADWTPLFRRNVVIWPDNDKAGKLASEKVCIELRKVGVKSIDVVDGNILEKNFPAKWDLADPLPNNMNVKYVQKLIATAIQKGIDPARLMDRISDGGDKNIYLMRANEVLWRVDCRLRSLLESEYGSDFRKVNSVIINESARILSKYGKAAMQGNELEKRKLAQFALHEAKYGIAPDIKEADNIENIIREFRLEGVKPSKSGQLIEHIVDQKIHKLCEVKEKQKLLTDKDFVLARQDVFIQAQKISSQLGKIERDQCENVKEQSLQQGLEFRF